MSEVLTAPLVVEFPFTRSLGPVQSAFLTGLRERTVLGVTASDGRVVVPPTEYDPVTAEEIRELVEVGSHGTVTTWAWNPSPRRGQPLTTPFAWILVRLDGADTALLHALDAPGPDAVRTGMRVRVRWAAQRTGAITDIACFEPDDSPAGAHERAPHSGEFANAVTGITTPARLDYTYSPGRAQSRYIQALSDHKTIGERCPSCRKVYVPPRGACPTCGLATDTQVEVGPRGTVTTFCIVNIKAKNLDIEVPYVYAHIALDGADLALHARIGGIPYDRVRMGLRVEPVWTEHGRFPDHYRPTGEPDADYDSYKELI
ncbi:Zn-ribbon domain-containing OB-fold protein [Streptomyces nigrescens]|uniref:DNA-binding protein n=2 Tax=Streptomyces nigrescens TaxID=1920 RepID=A0A640TVT2_STRNI|nr:MULTISPECIES: OB-fold nucleic acid binding domain-containing protein [Streptomyces]WAU00467.1 OB-fold domain-containing protein [Streptomyces libani subsp. libani]WAU08360.1 OB-fold domain-containing protein [Streptomyces nigrescens]GFE26301.1 DNA-binding protein [Streptomyces libani subsp. libani]GGV97763.1 DNA-binding protein [Streptomyces libani subsp. libani]